MLTLDQIKKDALVSIDRIRESEISPRLIDMGLTEGQQVKIIYKAPLGDPVAVEVGSYVLSLRKNEAALVEVSSVLEEEKI